VVLRHGTADLLEGTIFDDAPEHASLEELVELAGNHDNNSEWLGFTLIITSACMARELAVSG
jgi:hypothetical protein